MTTSIPYDKISVSSRSEPGFRKCCFCFPLRTGCFILGYLNLIIGAYHVLSLLAFTIDFGMTTHGFDHFDGVGYTFDQDFPAPPRVFEKSLLNKVEVVLIVRLCCNIFWLLTCVACVVGLHKKQPGPIKVYVWFACVRLVLFCVLLLMVITTYSYNHHFIIYCIDIGLNAYFICVYYMYAKQLEHELIETRAKQAGSLPGIEKGPLPTCDEKGNGIVFISGQINYVS